MNEERTFQEELKEVMENAASAGTEEPRTPMEDFVFWLRDLGGCASLRGNFISLDRTKADVLAADASEAFQSKSKCRDAAERRVDKAIREAQRKMEARMSTSGDSSFFQEYRQQFDCRLDALRGKLELLRTSENATILDEMEQYLTASEIHRKAKELCGNLARGRQLESANVYYTEISYDVWDPSEYEEGFAKLCAKGFMRYGFSCYEAIQAIEKDTQATLNNFQADFNSQIQDEILANIVEPVR